MFLELEVVFCKWFQISYNDEHIYAIENVHWTCGGVLFEAKNYIYIIKIIMYIFSLLYILINILILFMPLFVVENT